jgi:hypothetical protein
VDNSSSMAQYWSHATFAIEILAWRALGYDDDGMELYFTDESTGVRVKQSKDQSVKDFTRAMKQAYPKHFQLYKSCGIVEALQKIMTEYNNQQKFPDSKKKKKTVIVLTDGVWYGLKNPFEVEFIIKKQLRQLQSSGGDGIVSARPFTMEFIRFGHDLQGMERLRRLDDDLMNDGLP